MAILIDFDFVSYTASGAVNAGGTVTFYDTGTATPKTVYSDAALTTALANPFTLDNAGRFSGPVYAPDGERYAILESTSGAASIRTRDPVWGSVEELISTSYTPSHTGASQRTIQAKLDERATTADFPTIAAALAWAEANDGIVEVSDDQTVNIPTDAATLQIPLDHLVQLNPKKTITLNIETSHALTAGFRVEDGDYSRFLIQSADATVTLDAAFAPVSNTDLESDIPRTSSIAFLGVRAQMPVLNTLINCTGISLVTGLELDYGSTCVVRAGDGVQNVDGNGGANGTCVVVSSTSSLQAAQANFSGGNLICASVTSGSMANFQDAVLTGTPSSTHLDISRGSVVHAQGIDCSGAGLRGIYVRRSVLSAQDANVGSNTLGALAAYNSKVTLNGATFDSCAVDVQVGSGSAIDVTAARKSSAALEPADSSLTLSSGSTALPAFNRLFGGGQVTNQDYDVQETATGTFTSRAWIPVTVIDSSAGAVTVTLGSVDADMRGHIKTIVMTDATNSSTVSVTNHETSNPEVITFSAVDDTAVLLWTGTEWITLTLSGATV